MDSVRFGILRAQRGTELALTMRFAGPPNQSKSATKIRGGWLP